MRINAISSNSYMSNRNINKNNNPSFGEITNMPKITARIEQDVKSGKVSRDIADQTLEGLKKMKFSLQDCLDRFSKTVDAPKTYTRWETFKKIYNEFYLPLLEKDKLNYDDLPFSLSYSFGPFDPPECYRGPRPKENYHYFSLVRDFNDIQYDEKEMMFVHLKDDEDRRVFRMCKSSALYPTYTECLKHFIDEKSIEEDFYHYYVRPILKNISHCSFIPNGTIKGFPAKQTSPGPL